MSAFVSEASISRGSTHSQAGLRPQTEGGEAESPFANLLDSCGMSDTDSAGAPQASEETVAADVPVEAKAHHPDAPAVPEKAQTGADDAAEAFSAELLLLLAMAGQPVTDPKEATPVTDAVSGEAVVHDIPPGTDSEPNDGTADTDASALPAPPTPAPTVIAAAAPPLPVPASIEVAADSAPVPELDTITPATPTSSKGPSAVATDISSRTDVDAADTEKTSRSAEAIEATLAAHPDKNKKLEAAKPTSASAERTLDTPAAFRSAADSEAPTAKTENPKAGGLERADLPPKETPTAAKESIGETSTGKTDLPEASPRTAASQPSPESAPDAPVIPMLSQANTGAQPVTQPAVIQPGPAGPVPVTGLAVEIAAHAQAGKNRFEIRLDPPELGRIDVRLDVGSDGQVTSHLRVERAETLDLLRRDAPMLERALQQAGLKTSDNGLQFSLRDQSFSWQQQQQQDREMPTMARIVVPDETLAPLDTQRQYGRLVGLGGGVDIRV